VVSNKWEEEQEACFEVSWHWHCHFGRSSLRLIVDELYRGSTTAKGHVIYSGASQSHDALLQIPRDFVGLSDPSLAFAQKKGFVGDLSNLCFVMLQQVREDGWPYIQVESRDRRSATLMVYKVSRKGYMIVNYSFDCVLFDTSGNVSPCRA
jgi:hypothetical protein